MNNVLVLILFIGSIYGFVTLVADIAGLAYTLRERAKRKKAAKEFAKAIDDAINAFLEHEETQQDEEDGDGSGE